MAMGLLSMMEAKLPPGFRFHPRDEELINDYLMKRVAGEVSGCPMMVDVDLNKVEPWDLPEEALVGGKEWYFYSLRDRKYATGQRTNRATLSGYWKATGKDRQVVDGRRGGWLVGMRKTLVFYQGRAPKGKKTDWVMHEYRVEGGSGGGGSSSGGHPKPISSFKEDWVLCRVFFKSRGLLVKPNSIENCYDDTGSSSLPPLMDTFINFEQSPVNLQGYEQVPCFSNFPSTQPPPHRQPPFHHPPPPPQPPVNMANKNLSSQLGSLPDLASYLNPYSCEKKAIKAVLDHLTKMEGGGMKTEEVAAAVAATMVDGGSESFLTESGAHSMWNTF